MQPKPIWTEGLFVSQHHFQAQDLYHEANLNDRVAAVRRFDWGLLDVAIDERLLQASQFAVQRLEAVWPDGLVVRCGGSSEVPRPEPRSFEGLFAPELERLDVFLGIAAEGMGVGQDAAERDGEGGERFARTTRRATDRASGSVQEIDLAVPRVRVVFGTEPRDGLVLLPIAQLGRQSGGRVVLRDNFVPPTLRLAAAPFLTDGLGRVLGAMTARQRDLAATRKQRTTADIEFHHTDARRFWLLHTLNASVPVLTHLLEVQRAHPEEVYLALASLAGQLETFSPAADPAAIPAFDYLGLGSVFEVLFARVLSLLSVDSAAIYTEIPLQHRPDGAFMGKIPERRLLNHEFFVAVTAPLPEAAVRERIPQILKGASWNQIFDVVKQARHGVRFEVEWNPPGSLPVQPGRCFFRVRREGAFWDEIAKTGTLALYLPSDADWKDVALSVYALHPEHAR